MLQKIFIVAALSLLSCTFAMAQTVSVRLDTLASAAPPEEEKEEPKLTISGSVDAYYRNDLADVSTNSYTSFTPMHNSFALGMASIKFEHTGKKITAVADLGFGPRARDFSYADDGITQAIKQAYVSYSPADWVTFTMGTWGTHVGYELLDPQLNRNYSMSYMFTNGPFSHTGFSANISAGKSGFMLGVANATDYRIPPEDMINRKFLLAQYSLQASDNVSVFVNYAGGQFPDSSKSSQLDAVVTAKFSDKFSIGYNGTVNSTKLWDGSKHIEGKTWWGSALYLNFDPQPWFGLTLRNELFSDKNQFKAFAGASEGGNVFASTLSANFKSGGFTFIPEFRIDNASKNVLFTNKNGSFTKSAASLIFAAIYTF